jgi:glycosyltransferase involved in cell wall biosynthesis
MGYGAREEQYRKRSAEPPYAGRVFLVPPVPPSELLEWTASASLLVMAIQPTSLNHRYTTPQKLFEAMAAGTPVVASDLPGIRAIVREAMCGVLCDPTSPSAIAAAMREVLTASRDNREAFRAAALKAAHDRYNWETEVETLLAVYERLSRP